MPIQHIIDAATATALGRTLRAGHDALILCERADGVIVWAVSVPIGTNPRTALNDSFPALDWRLNAAV